MEITEEQYARIKDSLPVQRGNVSLTNLQVLNAILYVAEQGCKWPEQFSRIFQTHTQFAEMPGKALYILLRPVLPWRKPVYGGYPAEDQLCWRDPSGYLHI